MELCVRNEAGQHALLDQGGLDKVSHFLIRQLCCSPGAL
jgi:hypothetical protein